jgi:hypothetical protein
MVVGSRGITANTAVPGYTEGRRYAGWLGAGFGEACRWLTYTPVRPRLGHGEFEKKADSTAETGGANGSEDLFMLPRREIPGIEEADLKYRSQPRARRCIRS